jgi:hypothetical protein
MKSQCPFVGLGTTALHPHYFAFCPTSVHHRRLNPALFLFTVASYPPCSYSLGVPRSYAHVSARDVDLKLPTLPILFPWLVPSRPRPVLRRLFPSHTHMHTAQLLGSILRASQQNCRRFGYICGQVECELTKCGLCPPLKCGGLD